ncbi:MAG: precorrin-6y C5,15-methyltransferase (decarboxylating) subunit CbiE [Chloroflexi bacterium]|nr:precorrin-6y C5,15-methyltransferase (decarboxylating) subunit CbiE [Chloroflexota bacterium]
MDTHARVHVVGVGPGDPSYVPVRTRALIENADVVAGFTTVLDVVRPWIRGAAWDLDYHNQTDRLAELGTEIRRGRRCVVCTYGDPTFSERQLLDRVRAACGEYDLTPGISALQVACARSGAVMEESIFITFHKRDPVDRELQELAWAAAHGRSVLVLPRPWDFMPPEIARYLLSHQVDGSRGAVLCERLTLPGERVRRFTLEELARSPESFSDLTVLVIERRSDQSIG